VLSGLRSVNLLSNEYMMMMMMMIRKILSQDDRKHFVNRAPDHLSATLFYFGQFLTFLRIFKYVFTSMV